MLINPAFIPAGALLGLGLLMILGLGVAVRYAPWHALLAVPGRLHLVFGAALGCTLLWLLSIRLGDVATVHLLAMTSVTLVLGWCLAILAGSLALVIQVIVLGDPLLAIPAAWLFTVALPASLSAWLVSRLPRHQNLFLYTLGGGFAGGMLSALSVALAAIGFLYLIGESALATRGLEAWPMLALILFPEGFINGMLVTAACVFFPGALKTFDEQLYFGKDDRGAH